MTTWDWRSDPVLRAAILPADNMHFVVRYMGETVFVANLAEAKIAIQNLMDRHGRYQGRDAITVGPFPGKPEDQTVPVWEVAA